MSIKHFPADTSMEYKTFLNDNKIDGELYGYLLSMSYGEEGRTVVYKSNLPTREKLGEILKISRKTLYTHMKYLKEKGYIVEEKDKYYIPKIENMYFKIPQETIHFLQDTVKEPVIKTFIYLGQRNNYKPGQYVFTLKEICEHLGLSYKHQCSTINNYLIILAKCGLIEYTKFYEKQIPKMRLLKVETKCPEYKGKKYE